MVSAWIKTWVGAQPVRGNGGSLEVSYEGMKVEMKVGIRDSDFTQPRPDLLAGKVFVS